VKRSDISVVMSVYNDVRHVEAAVKSILCQTYADFEFLVIDDASVDGTYKLLTKSSWSRDPRLRVIRNETRQGLTRNLNRIIALSHGKFIARQDSDDESLPYRFEIELSALHQSPDIVAVGSHMEIIGRQKRVPGKPVPTNPVQLRQMIPFYNPLIHGSVMIRRSALEELARRENRRMGDDFPYREGAGYSEDYDLWLRLVELGELANVSEILYRYRLNYRGVSSSRCVLQSRYCRLVQALASERVKRGSDRLQRGERVELPNLTREESAAILCQQAYKFTAYGLLSKAILWHLKAIATYPPILYSIVAIALGPFVPGPLRRWVQEVKSWFVSFNKLRL